MNKQVTVQYDMQFPDSKNSKKVLEIINSRMIPIVYNLALKCQQQVKDNDSPNNIYTNILLQNLENILNVNKQWSTSSLFMALETMLHAYHNVEMFNWKPNKI